MLKIDKIENGQCWIFLTEDDLAILDHIIRLGQKELYLEFNLITGLIYRKINVLLEGLDIKNSVSCNKETKEYYYCLDLIYLCYIERMCFEFWGGFFAPVQEIENCEYARKTYKSIRLFFERYKKDFDEANAKLNQEIRPEDYSE